MPNDAKVGLVVGVGLVVAVAIFFTHKGAVPSRGPHTAQAVSTSSGFPNVRPAQQVSGQLPAQSAHTAEPLNEKEPGESAPVTVASPRRVPGKRQDP